MKSNELKSLYYTVLVFALFVALGYLYRYYPEVTAVLMAVFVFAMTFVVTWFLIYWVGLGGPKR